MPTPLPLSLPPTRVVVMEDRAQVERRGPALVPPGRHTFEVAGLSLATVDRSLKVEVTGSGVSLVDSSIKRRWREKPPGGLPVDASELRRRVETLKDAVAAGHDEATRLATRLTSLEQARADVLRAMAELSAAGQADTSRWSAQLDTLDARHREAASAQRQAHLQQQRLEHDARVAEHALATSEERERDFECLLWVTVENTGPAPAAAELRVSTLVPCAVWRPSYRASLTGQTVRVEAQAVVWQRTGEPWADIELAFSTARPTLGTTPPSLLEDRLSTRPKSAVEKRVVDVALREETIQTAGEGGTPASNEMPGLDDGGEARLLVFAGKATIASDGQAHTLPLTHFEAPATVERVCPAELSSLVFTVARFANTSGQPLLAGPVDLIRQAGFVGRGALPFTAPNEVVKLSFGSEDGVQVTRVADEKRDEARLTGRKTTKKIVTLHVSNASSRALDLGIDERIVVSEVKEVEVRVLTKECTPAPTTVSADGIARLNVSLPPNGTKTVTFTWELSAASKVAGV